MSGYIDGTEAGTVAHLAQAQVEQHPVAAGDTYAVSMPEGHNHKVVDLESLLDQPRRKRGTVQFTTGGSLEDYVNVHKGDGSDSLWADRDALRVVAVLNDHSRVDPGWGDHRAILTLGLSPEWRRWLGLDGKLVAQTRFAEHIEDSLAEIIDPPGADLLELAQTFEANTQVQFRSSQLLDSGQVQLRYEETIDAKAGKTGSVVVPKRFTVLLAPFEDLEVKRIDARLRYRISDGALAIGYKLDRPDLVLRDAWGDVLASLEEATGIAPYYGTPGEPLAPAP